MRSARHMQGVMLLEALIGVLIFSIGILGLVGLQAASIKNTAEARYRGEAAYLVNQIVGRMWTDHSNVPSYALGSGTTCTNGATALQTWLCQVEATLPGVTAGANRPTITVATDTTQTPNVHTVTVTLRWQMQGADARTYSVITRING